MHALAGILSAVVALVSGFFGATSHPATPVAGTALPQAAALFETSLAGRIISTDTSMTLAANSVGGSALSGYNCFTIDEGRSEAEFVCGTVSGTSVTGLERGVSALTGTTTSPTFAYTHRVGANVKITDFPLLQRLKAQANGEDTYQNILSYTSHPTFTATAQLVDKKYVDDIAFSGAAVVDATTLARGVVELATQAEAASSTSQGSAGVLAIPASAATSTFNAATAALRVLMTQNGGKIDNNFLATSTLFATSSIYTANPALGLIGKNVQVFSSTGTTTFAVPSGVTRVQTTVIGGGGGGGSCTAGGSQGSAGGGGGSGGVSLENVDVTGTSTIQLFVGSGGGSVATGTWSTFGTNGFYSYANPGAGAIDEGPGGLGGDGVGGDLNLHGGDGGSGKKDDSVRSGGGGTGGSNMFGGGGRGAQLISGGNNGSAGGNYGGGGGGGACDNSSSASGGGGAQGIVIVRW
jgi:hypothetical protein